MLMAALARARRLIEVLDQAITSVKVNKDKDKEEDPIELGKRQRTEWANIKETEFGILLMVTYAGELRLFN